MTDDNGMRHAGEVYFDILVVDSNGAQKRQNSE